MAVVPWGYWEVGLAPWMLSLAEGILLPRSRGHTLFLAFLLTVRGGPGKWLVGSEDKPMSHFRKELALLHSSSPACRFSSPPLEHHAHTSTIFTDISYIRSLYKYIYTHVHIYRVHLQAQKPTSCPAVGVWEESWSYFWAALPGAGRKLTTAQEDGARWESWGDSACPYSSVPCLPAPPPKTREHPVCPV